MRKENGGLLMKFSEYLPIGTVVILNNGKKKLMIYGVGQTDIESNIDYDYIGVLYPEGNMGEGSQFLFNHSDIKDIFYRGYEDDERAQFIQTIEELLDSRVEND